MNNFSCKFVQSEIYALTGSSGVGKTTLLTLLSGLDVPTSGVVYYDTIRIDSLSEVERTQFRNETIGFIFQRPRLFAEFSLLEHILIKSKIAGRCNAEIIERALHLIHAVGLYEYRNVPVTDLSGGQQQRLCLAQALCNKPKFLFADEPTNGLDEKNAEQVIQLLFDHATAFGSAIVISTHDQRIINACTHKITL